MSNETAKPGSLFVCCACGKTSTTIYGFDELTGESTASRGWDESCMLNAKEFAVDLLDWNDTRTRVVAVNGTAKGTGDE
jgi:hypothetical protein